MVPEVAVFKPCEHINTQPLDQHFQCDRCMLGLSLG